MSLLPLIYIWSMPFHEPTCLAKGKRLSSNPYKLDLGVETESNNTGYNASNATRSGDCCDFFDSGNDHRNSSMPHSISMYITTTHATALMAGLFFFPCLFMW